MWLEWRYRQTRTEIELQRGETVGLQPRGTGKTKALRMRQGDVGYATSKNEDNHLLQVTSINRG